jgi:hypothetical protein
MNYKVKGILIVAAITSMLVVGLSMVTIMQNSLAYSRNTNTNTATSSASSSASASNTNTINNRCTVNGNPC